MAYSQDAQTAWAVGLDSQQLHEDEENLLPADADEKLYIGVPLPSLNLSKISINFLSNQSVCLPPNDCRVWVFFHCKHRISLFTAVQSYVNTPNLPTLHLVPSSAQHLPFKFIVSRMQLSSMNDKICLWLHALPGSSSSSKLLLGWDPVTLVNFEHKGCHLLANASLSRQSIMLCMLLLIAALMHFHISRPMSCCRSEITYWFSGGQKSTGMTLLEQNDH